MALFPILQRKIEAIGRLSLASTTTTHLPPSPSSVPPTTGVGPFLLCQTNPSCGLFKDTVHAINPPNFKKQNKTLYPFLFRAPFFCFSVMQNSWISCLYSLSPVSLLFSFKSIPFRLQNLYTVSSNSESSFLLLELAAALDTSDHAFFLETFSSFCFQDTHIHGFHPVLHLQLLSHLCCFSTSSPSSKPWSTSGLSSPAATHSLGDAYLAALNASYKLTTLKLTSLLDLSPELLTHTFSFSIWRSKYSISTI